MRDKHVFPARELPLPPTSIRMPSTPPAPRSGARIGADGPMADPPAGMTPWIGIVGEEGLVEALEHLLPTLPADHGMAYLVLPLMVPDEARLEGLRERTPLPLVRVARRARIEPDHVYLLPAGTVLAATPEAIEAGPDDPATGLRPRLDAFLDLLARQRGPRAAAVVLSGHDADAGAIDVGRLRAHGGVVIVQDPSEAAQAALPRAVIASGMVDRVLPAARIGARLRECFPIGAPPGRHLGAAGSASAAEPDAAGDTDPATAPTADDALLLRLLDLLRRRTGRAFDGYGGPALRRRIARRMRIHGVATLQDYLRTLDTRPGETEALRDELWLPVGTFFRDPPAFAALRDELPSLFQHKGPADVVRVWVAACATGEEAYSVAMLLADHARGLATPPAVQVFATDVAPEAIRIAREGLYPASIRASIPAESLQRHFVAERGAFRVQRDLRKLVMFAVHDLLRDLPFTRLDLLSCRYLVGDLAPPARARLCGLFHFALAPRGRLFLGVSEPDPGTAPAGFTAIAEAPGLFARRAAPARAGHPEDVPLPPSQAWSWAGAAPPAHRPPDATGSPRASAPAAGPRSGRRGWGVTGVTDGIGGTDGDWGDVHLDLLEQLGPPSILVDAAHDILHLSPGAGRYLEHPAGEPDHNLLRLVPPPLRIELRAALFRAADSARPVESRVALPDAAPLLLRVVPLRRGPALLYLVLLGAPAPQADAIALRPAAEHPGAAELDREIAELRSQLRETVRRHAVSVRELTTSNDELQASNEALRSAMEALRGSREELEAVNQEFVTVNRQLQTKVDELAHANSDLQNLMNATAIATLFLDRDLCIARYTPMAVTLFRVVPGDVGRPLADLTPRLQYAEVADDATRVLERLTPMEREVGLADGTWLLARLLPYRTMDDRIAGVVLSFIDITERKRADEISQWLSAVVASSVDAIISFSLQGTILSWNGGARRVFGHVAEDVIGQPLSVLARPGQTGWCDDMLARVNQRRSIDNLETLGQARDGQALHLAVTASPIINVEGQVVGGTASLRDITAARRNEEALRRSEQRLRLVIENARDYAIFSMDTARVITSWNSGAEHLLGHAESEAIGRPADMIFTAEDRAANVPAREAATAMRESRAADERQHQRKDGSRFWANGTLMRMDDGRGGAIGFVKILRDETQARQARAELQRSQDELLRALAAQEQARAALEKADSAKDRFLALLSHELRNPLAAVSTAAELLAGPALPDEQRRAIALLRRQARTMKLLLDDLLDVSRLAAGRFELRPAEVDLAEVIEPALEAVEATLRAAGHHLMLDLPAAPVRLRVDPLRVTQVLVNLLGNATKYTPPAGRIGLSVRVEGEWLRVVVSDDGVGIEPERLDQIFELYTQGPLATHALNDGLGLGLSLARTIVGLHHGTIEGASEGPGRGSRFTLRLPAVLAGAAPAAAAAVPPSAPPAAIPAMRDILVADDNTDASWALAQLLRRAGHRTRRAAGGAEALERAFEQTPDVAVLDIGMPDIDGVEVARRLRAAPATRDIVLVALTGWSSASDRARALEAGFDALLSKPADLQALLGAIERATTARRLPTGE